VPDTLLLKPKFSSKVIFSEVFVGDRMKERKRKKKEKKCQ